MRRKKKEQNEGSVLGIILIIITFVLIMSSAYALFNVQLAIDGTATIATETVCSGELISSVTFHSPWWNENKLRTIANFKVANATDQAISDWNIKVEGTTDLVITKYNDNTGYQANSDGIIIVEPYDYNAVINANSSVEFGFIIDSVGDPIIIKSISIGECEIAKNVRIYSDGTITGDSHDNTQILKSLEIVPSTANVQVGKTLHLEYTKTPTTATNTLSWSSLNPSIASVDENGVVTGVSLGTTTVKLTSDNGVEASTQITIVEENNTDEPDPYVLTNLTINPSSVTMSIGETLHLNYTKEPSTATNTLSWITTSDNISLTDYGQVTALSAGTAIVKLISSNGIEATSTIIVSDGAVDASNVLLTPVFKESWSTSEMDLELTLTNNNLSAFKYGTIRVTLPENTTFYLYNFGSLGNPQYSNGEITFGADWSSAEPGKSYTAICHLSFPQGTIASEAIKNISFEFISGS